MATYADLLTEALREIGALAQGQAAGPEDAQAALEKFNRLLDSWNADSVLIYNKNFVNYVLTPNLQPHTIGPTGTFVVTVRPIRIENANIVLNNVSPAVNSPLALRDDDWWAAQRVQGLANALPTDLYYSPTFPNGSLFLWPIPQIAYGIQLETLQILDQIAPGDLANTYNFPPAYRDAIVYNLAKSCCPSFGKTLSKELNDLAEASLGKIILPNTQRAPRIQTWDSGMPDTEKNKPTFNWLTGSTR